MATPNMLAPASATPHALGSFEATTGLAAAYTCPANGATKIETAVATNISGGAITFEVAIVPSGDAASNNFAVLVAFPLAPNESIPLNDYLGGAWLGEGDFIAIKASAVTALVLVMTGTEYT